MNFKKLEIFGFKSFADKLELKFDSGITCIVGPNGCGKSNVADSVRWVLGEQSAKLLRGNQMMDVIFNGTENRKSLSYCEVSLYFDNSQKIFPVEYEEIVVSRKLYRSGESEYSINKQVCRLKDVLDLMRDCGVGKEGYSIIGQGRIDEILSAKPEERRNIFEEACGISKFKAKKLETERKLIRTNDNILRLNDILAEIERQLKPLSSQAENAKVYLDLKETLKLEEVNNYICRYESFNSTKDQIETRLNAINDEYNMVQEEYDRAALGYEELFFKLNNLDKEIDNYRNRQLSITVDIEKQAGQFKLLSERIDMLVKQNSMLAEECQKNSRYKEKLESDLENLKAEKAEKQQKYQELLKESDILSSQFLETVNLIAKGEDDVEENQRKVIESLKRLSEIKSNLGSLITEQNVLKDKLNELLNNIIIIRNSIDSLTESLEQTEVKLDGLKSKKQEITSEKYDAAAKLNEYIKKRRAREEEANALQNEISSLNAKLGYLKNAKENFEGYSYSVKSLLSMGTKNADLSSRYEGTVAMLIDVPQQYEDAIDIALGQAKQNIVTLKEADAKYLVQYLKQNNMGRITFLPVDTVKGRTVEQDALEAAKSCKGFIGVADSLVKFDGKYGNIISGLLGKTFVCDNLDNAALIAKKIDYSVKIVTLDGDVIHPYGAITGGSMKKGSSDILSWDRQISETQGQLKEKQSGFEKARREIESFTKSCDEVQVAIEKLNADLHANDIEFTKLLGQADKIRADIKEKKQSLESMNSEKAKTEERLNYINGELKTADELENKINRQRDSADDIRQEQKSRYDVLRKKRDTLHERTTNIKVSLASLYTEISGCDNSISSISQQIQQIERDIEAARDL